jgi:argininosuccinate lyase
MKMWDGRFNGKNDPLMEAFNRSLDFDKRMIAEDITGSMAYAEALFKCGVLTRNEGRRLIRALKGLLEKKDAVRFVKSDEDVHMAVERLLTEKVGSLGKKIHTGRSRNDQVALDTRLYLKKEIDRMRRHIAGFMAAILETAQKHPKVILPAFTHLQMAQPVLLAHYLLSWFFMLERDAGRFADCRSRLDLMPLGSGAVAGSGFPLDRNLLARRLGFSRVSDNSMDSVSDRDHVLEFLSASAITAMHLSRFAEDLIIFASPGYKYVELSDAYSTGSSMMPNKKNPDSLELIRGKTGRIYGSLVTLLTVTKGLPLTYNKDLQEDKEALFGTIDTLKALLSIFTGVIRTLKLNTKKMEASLDGDLLATDLADALVKNGLPFRDAHRVVGRIVLDGQRTGKSLLSFTPVELKAYSPKFPANLRLSFKHSINHRSLYGGTGESSVKAQLKRAQSILRALEKPTSPFGRSG